MPDERILTTCPRDCYDACGIEVSRRGGAIRRVRGDPRHPVSRGRLCRKCATAYNGVLLDPRARHGLRGAGAAGDDLGRSRANVNALNPGTPGDMGASTTVHGVEITLARAG